MFYYNFASRSIKTAALLRFKFSLNTLYFTLVNNIVKLSLSLVLSYGCSAKTSKDATPTKAINNTTNSVMRTFIFFNLQLFQTPTSKRINNFAVYNNFPNNLKTNIQPPSGGCVLKPKDADVRYVEHSQPPSGGCVLKH